MNKKTKIIIIISAIAVVLAFIIGLIIYSFSPITKNNEEVIFVIEPGTSKVDIIDDLKESNLIKSKIAAYGLVFIGNNNLQAGKYQLNRNMSLTDIINKIELGDTYRKTFTITFVEGKRLTYYVGQIAEKLEVDDEEVLKTISDKEYLKGLINKYWFLTDEILNDELYYPLEGYLYPSTYEFFSDSTIESVLEKMLDTTSSKLNNYKEKIEASEMSVHEILAMASIIELEAVSKNDRQTVSQVIYSRLAKNWSLGMDVTSYYGVKKDMSEALTRSDINDNNPYNTRPTNKLGLPVGPICNPSIESVDAVFNPTNTNYMYFYADIKTGIVYFAETTEEFTNLIKEIGGN